MFSYASPLRSTNSPRASDLCTNRACRRHPFEQRNSALKTDRTASVIIRGHAFIQNLRRGHYELGVEARADHLRVATAFGELATSI